MSDAAAPYTVRARWAKWKGSSTFLCPAIEQALEAIARFEKDGYADIEILAPDGTPITKADLLERLTQDTDLSTGGPIIPDTLAAPVPLALAA